MYPIIFAAFFRSLWRTAVQPIGLCTVNADTGAVGSLALNTPAQAALPQVAIVTTRGTDNHDAIQLVLLPNVR